MSQLATTATRPTARPTTPTGTQSAPERTTAAGKITQEGVAQLAFQKWQKRGCPNGDAQRDWFEAEAELKARSSLRR